MRIFITSFFLVFSSCFFNLNAQVKSDDGSFKAIEKKLNENLDQLLNQWYIGKMTIDTNVAEMNKYGFKKGEIPTYSPEVYKKRLEDLQCPIPLPYNNYVKNYIAVYAVKKRAQVENMLGLANYYFPIFEEELAKYNMPLELKFIPVIESALNKRAVSRSGATGLWQFMYPTARLYKLQITSNIDERLDPYRITEAGVLYFKDMFEIYQDWLLVIAAFNCGPGAVNKAIEASGYKSDFWEVYPYLPQQTRGYVPAFIAANYIMNYYIEHNLYPKNIYNPGLLDTIVVNRRLDFKVLEKALQMPIEEIRELNPMYIKDFIPKSTAGYSYILRLPLDKVLIFHKHRDLIYQYQDHLDLDDGVGLNGYEKIRNRNNFKSENTHNYIPLNYVVKSGDNLNLIAEWFECTVDDIKRWNGMTGNYLNANKKLCIYVPEEYFDTYEKINVMTFQEKQKMIGKIPERKPARVVEYVMGENENLYTVVERFPGITIEQLLEWNKISLKDNLVPGYVIKIYLN
jgi:membrane-bound lytic murein transglycosylase D